MNKKFGVFINRKAGKGKPLIFSRLIQEELTKQQLLFEIFDTEWPANLNNLTDIFIVGGDGTVNYFINRYPECELPITIIRAGSGNDFHKELYGKKKDFKKNIETGLSGDIIFSDAGNCNGRWFLNGCGIGFDGKVVYSMQKKRQGAFGLSAYLLYVLKNIITYKSFNCIIKTKDEIRNIKAFMITIANGKKYGGGFNVAPGAKINDGKLNLVIIKKINPLLRLFHLPKIKTGNHTRLKITEQQEIETITIQSEYPVHAHTDGEYFSDTEFNISIHKGKFKFRVEKN